MNISTNTASQIHHCPFAIEPFWREVLKETLEAPYIAELAAFMERERRESSEIYPPPDEVFNAFLKTPFSAVKVVIIGQDPYHGPGQAHGLSFSVPKGVPLPPSLKNIYKELSSDLGLPFPSHGCLAKWAEQGVLLLNATLTVRQSSPMSHHNRGWERFTDAVVMALCHREKPVIFVLWGKSAQEKCRFIEGVPGHERHFVLQAPHPSPFSARTGFFGCRHFSKINELLLSQGDKPIDWRL